MGTAFLAERGIVEVDGPDARALLHRLVTSDVAGLRRGETRYAALLSPQGKITFDFLIVDGTGEAGPDRFLLDVPAAQAGDLARKLSLYRLRADVRIVDRSAELGVTAHWPDGPGPRDPRHPDLGTRAVGARAAADADAASAYDAHRIALGVPDGGRDFAYGDAFPHDANLDRLGGVDFAKGCYVGQEVVSRVHHRNSARKRVVKLHFYGTVAEAGAPLAAGETILGAVTSLAGDEGLAAARIDRLAEAEASKVPVTAGDTLVGVSLPAASAVTPPDYAEDMF